MDRVIVYVHRNTGINRFYKRNTKNKREMKEKEKEKKPKQVNVTRDADTVDPDNPKTPKKKD